MRCDVRLDSSRDLKWLRTFVNEWTSIDDAYKAVQSYRLCYHRVCSVHHRCIAIVRAVRDLHISPAFQCLIRNSKTKAHNLIFISIATSSVYRSPFPKRSPCLGHYQLITPLHRATLADTLHDDVDRIVHYEHSRPPRADKSTSPSSVWRESFAAHQHVGYEVPQGIEERAGREG